MPPKEAQKKKGKKMEERIECSSIHVGARFSAPVYFDDGVNMFLAEGHAAKQYHVAALKRWAIPFLMTEGHPLDDEVPAFDGAH